MNFIEIISETWVHHGNSAFPNIVKLNNSDLICGFNVGDGPEATGGSDWARSTDNGNSWQYAGVILPCQENPLRANSMRLSRTADGRVIAYGQRSYPEGDSFKFGTMKIDSVFCTADTACRAWSQPTTIPLQAQVPIEVSNPMIILQDGRWLAPAGLLTDKAHLGERVVVRESLNEGKNWDNEYTVFADPKGVKGFFEFKIVETTPGTLIAFAWTVELGTYKDFNNHYSISHDGGKNWSVPKATTINGQTLTPLWLGGDDFLLIYNYRQTPQGIRIAQAKITDSECKIGKDELLWQPGAKSPASAEQTIEDGIDTFDDFKFGLPSLTQLADKSFIAVFWCFEAGKYGVKSIKLNINNFS